MVQLGANDAVDCNVGKKQTSKTSKDFASNFRLIRTELNLHVVIERVIRDVD